MMQAKSTYFYLSKMTIALGIFGLAIAPVLAAPESLNPALYQSPPKPPPEIIPTVKEPLQAAENVIEEEQLPLWEPETLTVNFKDSSNNFSQGNLFFEPTISGRLPNGDRLSLTTGFNRLQQPEVTPVFNIPLKLDWQSNIGELATNVGIGLDFFDQLPTAVNFNSNVSIPLGEQAKLSFSVTHSPYKFNATTLNNQIKNWRYGPDLFWQIAPDTTFFSSVRWGRYNDGNREQQSFSRLEQRLGEFKLAANLFNWRYAEDLEAESGYFSPLDFLVVNGEVAWEKEVSDWLRCKVSASGGQQRLAGNWTFAYGYGGTCTAAISDSLELDINYDVTNITKKTGGNSFTEQSIGSQVRAKF